MTISKDIPNGKQSPQTYDIAKVSETKIKNWLIEKLAKKLDLETDEIDPKRDFIDYSLNSIEAVNLSGELESFLGRRLAPTLLWDYQNIEVLAQYLAAEILPDSSYPASERQAEEILPEYYNFELSPEYKQLKLQQQEIESLGLGNPFFIPQEGIVNNTTTIGDRQFINYATYNYLDMCGDPFVSAAANQAIARYGTSACASRLVCGEKPLHQELEREIAAFIGTEASIVYVGGHATNVSTIGHLFGKNDLIVHDSLSHNSILQGCFLSGATVLAFPHNDWEKLDEILSDRRSYYKRVLIVIEGIYSTDGDIAPLPQFIEIKKRHKTFLMVDEAHSIGVLGENGRGIGEYFAVDPNDVDLWMGTLSKSFASCGGYIAGSAALIEYLKYTAPGFVFSVGMAPPNAAATLAAIELLKKEPQRVKILHQRAKLFLQLAKERGLNTGISKDSPVIPIVVGDSLKSVVLSRHLFARGINVPFMFYPSVPQNEARLRFFITCTHTEEQIRFTVDALSEELDLLKGKNSTLI